MYKSYILSIQDSTMHACYINLRTISFVNIIDYRSSLDSNVRIPPHATDQQHRCSHSQLGCTLNSHGQTFPFLVMLSTSSATAREENDNNVIIVKEIKTGLVQGQNYYVEVSTESVGISRSKETMFSKHNYYYFTEP